MAKWPTNKIPYNAVDIMNPPAASGLTGAVGDGSDESTVVQAIVNYAATNHLPILIPEGHTFCVKQIWINEKTGWSIYGYGTLKLPANAATWLLKIEACSLFHIESLHIDGNYANGNSGNEGNAYSVMIFESHYFSIHYIHGINPAGDVLYLNDTNYVSIGTVIALGDTSCGRNPLTIIQGTYIAVDFVFSKNLSTGANPGGINLEANYSDQPIAHVIIKNAIIISNHGSGFIISNKAGASITDVEAHVTVFKYAHYVTVVTKVDGCVGFRGSFKVYQYQPEADLCYALAVNESSNVTVDLEAYRCKSGASLGVTTSNLRLTGKIIDFVQRGIEIWSGLANTEIDMEIREGHTGSNTIVVSSTGTVDNVLFKGDYSKDSGSYCFNIGTTMTNTSTDPSLITTGWTTNLVTGSGAASLVIG